MKKIHLRHSLLTLLTLVGVFVLASCSKGDSYCSAIPQDACVLGRVAPNELLEQNDLSVEKLLERFNAPQKVVEKFDLVKESGLDIEAPFYFFITQKGQMGLVAKMTDAAAFKTFLENEIKIDEQVQEAEGYYYVEDNPQSKMEPVLCFNDEKLLVLADSKAVVTHADAITLMEQGTGESVLDTDLYKQLAEAEKPMSVNIDMKSATGAMPQLAAAGGIPASQANMLSLVTMFVPNANLLVALDIQDERAGITADIFPATDDAEEQLLQMQAGCPTIKGDFLKYGTQDPLVWACMGIEGAKYLEQINKVPFLSTVMEEIKKTFDVEGALNSLSGDILFSLSQKNVNDDMPQVLLLAQTQDDKLAQSLKAFEGELIRRMTIQQQSPNQYTLCPYSWDGTPTEPMLFFGQKDKFFYATTAESLIQSEVDNKSVKAYEDDIEESQFFVLFDIQRLTTLLEDQFGNNAKQAEKLSKIKDMKDIVIKGNQFHVEFYLHMMPGKKVSESVLDLASQVCK